MEPPSTIQRCEVLVVGAGPAGSYCAAKLATAGMEVLVVDATPEPRRKVCGEYLCPSAATLLQRDGTLKRLTEDFRPIHGMKLAAPGADPIACHFPSHRDLSSGRAVNRQSFDRRLQQLATDQGAVIQRGVRIQHIVRRDGGWEIRSTTGETYHARLLIGADGRNSQVARALGIQGRPGSTRVALHCHVPSRSRTGNLGEMHVFDNGSYIGIDPTGDHEINLSLVCDNGLLRQGGSPREVLQQHIDRSPALRHQFATLAQDIVIHAVYPVTHRVKRFSGEGYALIGDAAGFLDPLTGEGMYQALWTASALAEELIGHAGRPQQAIRRYTRRKRRFFRHKVALNHLFQWLIRHPGAMRILSGYLSRKPSRADIFVGIIGNNYSPLQGLQKLITTTS